MITLINIPTPAALHFEECWELYECAFPPEERRERDYHIETMSRKYFHFDAIIEGDELIGMVGWWDLKSVQYIEHLAVLPTLRNGGYGRRILEFIKSKSNKVVLLEVEHPTIPIAKRRIGFYEREGFILNPHTYIHPPYRGNEGVNLLIMTYPNAISLDELEHFKRDYFPIIHFRKG